MHGRLGLNYYKQKRGDDTFFHRKSRKNTFPSGIRRIVFFLTFCQEVSRESFSLLPFFSTPFERSEMRREKPSISTQANKPKNFFPLAFSTQPKKRASAAFLPLTAPPPFPPGGGGRKRIPHFRFEIHRFPYFLRFCKTGPALKTRYDNDFFLMFGKSLAVHVATFFPNHTRTPTDWLGEWEEKNSAVERKERKENQGLLCSTSKQWSRGKFEIYTGNRSCVHAVRGCE